MVPELRVAAASCLASPAHFTPGSPGPPPQYTTCTEGLFPGDINNHSLGPGPGPRTILSREQGRFQKPAHATPLHKAPKSSNVAQIKAESPLTAGPALPHARVPQGPRPGSDSWPPACLLTSPDTLQVTISVTCCLDTAFAPLSPHVGRQEPLPPGPNPTPDMRTFCPRTQNSALCA